MSQAEVWEDEVTSPDGASWVPVPRLGVGSSFRPGGLCPEHVERLAALEGAWPPVLLARRDGSVIDGAHRVAAAGRLGMARIEAVWFDGSAADAYVEFVRRNVAHGLTLTVHERKAAAARVLRDHPLWSDRRVAEVCALSPKTVGRVRSDAAGCPNEEDPHSDERREGRDHRLRPVRPGSARARVLDALQVQPGGSLRTIAAVAGVSPETVRLVRMNLAEASAPVADDTTKAPETVDPTSAEPTGDAGEPTWQIDAALASSPQGDDFLAWFERTALHGLDLSWVDTIPLGRVYVVADEARRRSETWLQFARAVEARAARAR